MTNLENPNSKHLTRLRDLEAAAEDALEANPADASAAIADATRALKRIVARAGAIEGMERVSLTQEAGPTVEFTGRKLWGVEWEQRGREPMWTTFELWQTAGGAYVALTETVLAERESEPRRYVTVVEPGPDEQARRFAVLDHFRWNDRARKQCTKGLGWSLRRDVE